MVRNARRNSKGSHAVTEPASREQEGILVSRCLQGDSLAWEKIVASYAGRIGRLAGRYTRLRGEAEDLAQEVLLRVYLHLRTYRADSGNLSHWVTRVGRNLIIDYLRRNRHFMQRRVTLESLNLQNEQIPTPETIIVRDETARLVRGGLGRIAPDLQQVLSMRYLEDMSYEEISRRLGLPNGTVKSRISRGRARLAEIFGTALSR